MNESQLQSNIIIEVPEPTPLLNKWQRMHWTKRRRLTEWFSWLIRQNLGYTPKQPIQHCIVIIERHSVGLPDWDGLYGGLKPALDCLVRCSKVNPHGLGIIEDDNPNVIQSLQAIPCKSKRGEGKTVIRIINLEEMRDGKD